MLRIGFIGCGKNACLHGRAVQALADRVVVPACCDIDSIKGLEWRKVFAPTAEVYTSAEDMLKAKELDAVVITTWPSAHLELITICIEQGIRSILCEKALCVNAGEAAKIYQLVSENGVLLQEGYANLYHPRFAKLDDLVRSEGLGKADSVHAAFSIHDDESDDPADPQLSWRKQKAMAGGTPWEYSCFPIMIANRFINDVPVGVVAYGAKGRYDTIVRMHGMIEYLHGGVAFIQTTKQNNVQDLNLTFGDAVVNVPSECWDPSPESKLQLELRREGRGAKEIFDFDGADRFFCQLDYFCRCISGGAEPLIPLTHSIVGMYVLDGLVASMLDQVEVELDIPEAIVEAYESTLI